MSIEKSFDSSHEWKAVLVLSLTFGLVGLDRFILPPLFPTIMKDLRLNYQDLGNLVGALAMAWGVSAILVGNLSDRLGRRAVLVPAVIMFSLFSALSGLATGFVSLLVTRAVMGIAEGAVAPTIVAVAMEVSDPKRRGLNNGIAACTFALFGQGLGPILATQLVQVTSWRNVFFIVGIPGLIVAVFAWFVMREPRPTPSATLVVRERTPLSAIFSHRNVPLAMLALLCAMTGVFVLFAIMPNYLVDTLKLTGARMGFVTSAIGLGGMLGQLALPAASDFIGRRGATLLSFSLSALCLWIFIRTGADLTALFALLAITAFFNFGALAILAGPIPAEAAPPRLVATAAGLVIGTGEIFGLNSLTDGSTRSASRKADALRKAKEQGFKGA